MSTSTKLTIQNLKANFVVNICDKDQADKFVKNFGKVNGSNFRQPREANRRQSFFGTRFVCCRKVKVIVRSRRWSWSWPGKAERCWKTNWTMITTMRWPRAMPGTFWKWAKKQKRDILNFSKLPFPHQTPGWLLLQRWKTNLTKKNGLKYWPSKA